MTAPSSNQFYSQTSGTQSSEVFLTILESFNPSSTQYHYPIGKRWVNTSTYSEWILANLESMNGIISGNWIELGSGGNGVRTLTGNTGGAVGADTSANINVVGDGTTITVSGSPSTHTLTISAIGAQTVSFSAYTDTLTDNVTGDGTQYVVKFDNIRYNTGSGYNITTGVFTAPLTGIYQFNCNLWTSTNTGMDLATSYVISFSINGNINQYWSCAKPTAQTCSGYYFGGNGSVSGNALCDCISQSFFMNAEDTTSVYVTAYGATSKTFSIGTNGGSAYRSNFNGYLVG